MRIVSTLLFGVTLFSSLVNADTSSTSTTSSLSPEDDTSQVLVLTDDNFDARLTTDSLLLVKFYTPWCGYCKALAPEYEAAAVALRDMTDKVTMAEVDCSLHEELCIDHDIGSFPTIKLFRNGIPTLYDGPRQSHAITRYLLRQTQPAVTLLEQDDQEALNTLRQLDNTVVVGSGSTHDNNTAYTTFKLLADEWRDRYMFGWIAVTNGSEDDGGNLVLYTRFDDHDDTMDIYTGDRNAIDTIKTFLRHHAIPLFGPMGPDNYLDYEEAALPLAYLFIDSTFMLESFHDPMTALAQHYRGVVNFVYIDADAYPEQADYLGINTTVPDDDDDGPAALTRTSLWPAFVIQDTDFNRFVLSQKMEVNADTIRSHVDRFLEHTLTPFLLSDPIPNAPNDGPVKVVVGTQFQELVTNADHDVLLKVYAPWCGHCKALAPVYQQLGELVQQQSYPLRVASLDGSSNDMPADNPAAFDVDAFPTIAFIEAHTHRVALFPADKDRSLAELVKFIHEQKEIAGKAGKNDPLVMLQLPQDDKDDNGDDDALVTKNDVDSDEIETQQQQMIADDITQSNKHDETTFKVDDDNTSGDDDQIRISQVHDEL
ncbi:thioredoxin-like protein [Absidia repens]|uniref:protein disulfide-isomerase n=1 Tax=Absidia repens TaxID=90262 RepID=A0A1X2IKM7_9FUNG|nr:thioredoxin-like protein [Absidia repens]